MIKTTDSLSVYLHGLKVGDVNKTSDGRIRFQLNDQCLDNPSKPILSQSFVIGGEFEGRNRPTTAGLVPPFFANLLPEGALRTYIAEKAGVSEHREFELLELCGSDLPGAVAIKREDEQEKPPVHTSGQRHDDSNRSDLLRFSLAGVQLKFSAIQRRSGGFAIPAGGLGGDWIVKPPSPHYSRLPENEYSMMTVASYLGLDAPEVRLVPLRDIEGLPFGADADDERDAFVIKRFDRADGCRTHMEDFAQVLEQQPREKYNPQVNYTKLVKLIYAVCGEEGAIEFARRLMFNTIIGNGDMHLKNWSFIYLDGQTAKLSPIYDYLCTTIYIPRDESAFKLGSTKKWHQISLDEFGDVAEGAGLSRDMFVSAAVDIAVRFSRIWDDCVKQLPMDDGLKESVERQMTKCPAIVSSMKS